MNLFASRWDLPCRCSCILFFFVAGNPALPYPPPRYSCWHSAAWKISNGIGWRRLKWCEGRLLGRQKAKVIFYPQIVWPSLCASTVLWCCWLVWQISSFWQYSWLHIPVSVFLQCSHFVTIFKNNLLKAQSSVSNF